MPSKPERVNACRNYTEPSGNQLGTGFRPDPSHPLKGGEGRNQSAEPPKKFATKQAANRERRRVEKLEQYQAAAARMVEGRRIAAEERARRAAEAEAKREARARLAAARRQADGAVQTYRTERDDKARAERMAYLEDSIRSALKKVDEEIAAKNPRTGRPRTLRNLHLKSDPANALINALSPWGFAE